VSLHEIVGKNGTEAERFMINFACKKKDAQVTVKLNELKKNNTASFELIWNEQIQNYMNTDDLIAHLQETPSSWEKASGACMDEFVIGLNVDECNLTDNPASENTSANANSSLDSTTLQAHSLPENDVTRPVTLNLKASLDLVKSDGDNDLPFVTGLAFLLDGRIAAVDFTNRACFILNIDLQRQGSSFRFKEKPRDVACFKDGNFAVTFVYVHEIMLCKIAITPVS